MKMKTKRRNKKRARRRRRKEEEEKQKKEPCQIFWTQCSSTEQITIFLFTPYLYYPTRVVCIEIGVVNISLLNNIAQKDNRFYVHLQMTTTL